MRNIIVLIAVAILLIAPLSSFAQFATPLPIGQGPALPQLLGGLFSAAGDADDENLANMLFSLQQLLGITAANGQVPGALGDISGFLANPSQRFNLPLPDLTDIVDQMMYNDIPPDINALQNMIPDELRNTAEQYRQQFGGFDPSMLEGIDSSMLSGIDPGMLNGIDPSMLNGFDLGMFGGIDPSMLGNFDPAMLQQLLQSGGLEGLFGGFGDLGALLGGGGDLSGIDLNGLMQMLGGLGLGQGDLSGLFDE